MLGLRYISLSQGVGEGVWTVVQNRKDSGDKDSDKATRFFITNFPEDWGIQHLKKAFEGFGRLVEVYIEKKKSKDCRSFGFLRYVGIRNPDSFGKLLDGIPVGGFKARVNIARYERKAPAPPLPK